MLGIADWAPVAAAVLLRIEKPVAAAVLLRIAAWVVGESAGILVESVGSPMPGTTYYPVVMAGCLLVGADHSSRY